MIKWRYNEYIVVESNNTRQSLSFEICKDIQCNDGCNFGVFDIGCRTFSGIITRSVPLLKLFNNEIPR